MQDITFVEPLIPTPFLKQAQSCQTPKLSHIDLAMLYISKSNAHVVTCTVNHYTTRYVMTVVIVPCLNYQGDTPGWPHE